MLQFQRKPLVLGVFLSICLSMVFLECRSDASTISEDEFAYLADYVAPGYRWGFVDTTGNVVIKPQFDETGSFSEGLTKVNISGKWGFVNTYGEIVIRPEFRAAWSFSNNRARVQPFGEPAQYIDRMGNTIAQDGWEAYGDFADFRAVVKIGANFGYIDTSGNVIVPIIYTECKKFRHQRAVVRHNNHYGVMDPEGNFILDNTYDRIKITEDNTLILCSANKKEFVFDINGNEIINLADKTIIATDGKIMAIRNGTGMELITVETGTPVDTSIYLNSIYLDASRWACKNTSGYILVNQQGHQVGLDTFDQVNRFSDGFAVFRKNNTFGFVDTTGNKVLELEYGLVWDYKEGFARTAFTDGMIFLNKTQKPAFHSPLGTIALRDFSEGLAAFKIEK